jgi:predicted nucleic acid-binding protein
MTFVVDASVALAWCLDDERSTAANAILERLASDPAIVPAIWPFEVASGLRAAERRGRITMVDALRSALVLRTLPIEIEPADVATILDGCAAIARRLDLSVYDAAYVSLAIARRLPLATADERVRRACTLAGVEVIG